MTTKKCSKCGITKSNTSDEYPWGSNQRGKKLSACCKVCVSLRNRQRLRSERIAALRHYSDGDPRCACCGDSNLEFLSFDHVNNDGAEQRRKNPGVSDIRSIATWLRKNNYPKDIRVLCYNCNCSIGFYGYCPHQQDGGWFWELNTRYEGAKSDLYCPQGHPMFGESLKFWQAADRRIERRRICQPCEASKSRDKKAVIRESTGNYAKSSLYCKRDHPMFGKYLRFAVKKNGTLNRLCAECRKLPKQKYANKLKELNL